MEVQLFALTIIGKLISSDCGVQAVLDAMVIPRLVELLDLHSESATDVVCQSALVLSHMALYQHPCMAMVNAGVIAAFSRLLLRPISNRMLVVVATSIGHCATQHRHSWNRHNLFSRDVLQPLINLLFFTQTEVWLAAAMAIGSIARCDKKIRQHFLEGKVPNHLCYLFLKCTNSLALETVSCSIGRIFYEKTLWSYGYADFDFSDNACPLLTRLLGREGSEMQMGAIRALRSLAYTFQHTEWRGAPIHKTFILKLTTLLTGDNDELFVEAVLTILQLKIVMFSLDFRTDRLECITMVEIRRLIHLLSYDKEWVAGRAALAIGKIVNGHCILRDIDYQLIASCGVRPLICLLSSSNLDVVRTATRTIGLIFSDMGHPILPVDKGVVPALVDCLARNFDCHAILNVILQAIVWLLDSEEGEDTVETMLIRAGAIPYVIRLLTLQAEASVLSVDNLHYMVKIARRGTSSNGITSGKVTHPEGPTEQQGEKYRRELGRGGGAEQPITNTLLLWLEFGKRQNASRSCQ